MINSESILKADAKIYVVKVCVCVVGRVSKWAYFCIQLSPNLVCLMFNPVCLLYCVIQDFVQKALFSEIQAIRSGWGNCMMRGIDINTVLNHCTSALDKVVVVVVVVVVIMAVSVVVVEAE